MPGATGGGHYHPGMEAAAWTVDVDGLVARARAAYPQFAVDPGAFAGHLSACGGGSGRPAEVSAEDLYLAFAAAQGDRHALEVIEQSHLARIGRFIAHLRQEPSFVDEVRQALRERVLVGADARRPKILDYSGRGPLGAWFRVTAIRQRHLPQFREAFRCALASLDARERNLLRLYLVDGLNIARIGEIFGKSRATIGRMVIDCREKLLGETRRNLGALTGASAGDVLSLIRLLRSQLDVSVRSFLRRQEPG